MPKKLVFDTIKISKKLLIGNFQSKTKGYYSKMISVSQSVAFQKESFTNGEKNGVHYAYRKSNQPRTVSILPAASKRCKMLEKNRWELVHPGLPLC